MTEHEKYQEHIQHTHDVFCKAVIRHAAIDAARSIRSRRKREISLEYLIEEKRYPFSTVDKYFSEQAAMNSYPLFVCGQIVLLECPKLAAAAGAVLKPSGGNCAVLPDYKSTRSTRFPRLAPAKLASAPPIPEGDAVSDPR